MFEVQVVEFRVVVRRLKIESAAELYICGEAATTSLKAGMSS